MSRSATPIWPTCHLFCFRDWVPSTFREYGKSVPPPPLSPRRSGFQKSLNSINVGVTLQRTTTLISLVVLHIRLLHGFFRLRLMIDLTTTFWFSVTLLTSEPWLCRTPSYLPRPFGPGPSYFSYPSRGNVRSLFVFFGCPKQTRVVIERTHPVAVTPEDFDFPVFIYPIQNSIL